MTPFISSWLTGQLSSVGKHSLRVLSEISGSRSNILQNLTDTCKSHYVPTTTTSHWLNVLGATDTAIVFREHLPTTKKARSGDLGEILATEIAEHFLNYHVPIRRLRWKDGRNMALRGDDIIAVTPNSTSPTNILKGESKSRAAITPSVINEASTGLEKDAGRPNRHAVLYVAARLREAGNIALADYLTTTVLNSFSNCQIEHLLFVFCGNNPQNTLNSHLSSIQTNSYTRHAIGVRIIDHQNFISNLYAGM